MAKKRIKKRQKASQKVRPIEGKAHEIHIHCVDRNHFGNSYLWVGELTKTKRNYNTGTGIQNFVTYLVFRGFYSNLCHLAFDYENKGQKSPQCREWQIMGL